MRALSSKTARCRWAARWLLFGSLLGSFGCGTLVGNPDEGGDGGETSESLVEITSSAFDPSAALWLSEGPTPFALCLKHLKVKYAAKSETDSKDFQLGLLDLSAGEAKSWGEASLRRGARLEEIIILAEKNTTLCGVDYSVSFGDELSEETANFRWTFEPAIELDAESGLVIELALDEILATLKRGQGSGKNVGSLKERIETSPGKGRKKNKKI